MNRRSKEVLFAPLEICGHAEAPMLADSRHCLYLCVRNPGDDDLFAATRPGDEVPDLDQRLHSPDTEPFLTEDGIGFKPVKVITGFTV